MTIQTFSMDDSIESVIEKYAKMVFGISLSHTKNKADADDVFQEVFLIYHNKKVIFHDEEHRKAWLIKTTINCSKKIISSKWRKNIVLINEIDEVVFEFALKEENLVYTALCELPTKYRMVIYLFYFEDLSIDEMSKALHVKEGTIKVQLTRGRNLMREKLKGDYFHE